MAVGFFDRRDLAAGQNPDAVRFHLDPQVLAHVVVKAAQDILAAINQRHLRAQAGENARKLDGNIAAALNYDAARQFRQMKRLVRSDGVLDARDGIAVARRTAGSDQDVSRAHALTARQLHCVRVDKNGAALRHFDARFVERGAVSRFEAGNFAILVGDQRRPIE